MKKDFFKNLLTCENVLNLSQEKKQEKKTRENKKTLVIEKQVKTYEDLKKKFSVSLFNNKEIENKKEMLDFVLNLENHPIFKNEKKIKISNKIKNKLVELVKNEENINKDDILNYYNILNIENLIEKNQKKDKYLSIELEGQLNLYINNSFNWKIQKINFFFLITNALKKKKFLEDKKDDKYEDINTNFFGVDESKIKTVSSQAEKLSNKILYEKIIQDKNYNNFIEIYNKKENIENEIDLKKWFLNKKIKWIIKGLENNKNFNYENLNKKNIKTLEKLQEYKNILENLKNELKKKQTVYKNQLNKYLDYFQGKYNKYL